MAGQNRYNFTSPGADASDAMLQFLANQEIMQQKRQSIVDARNEKSRQLDIQDMNARTAADNAAFNRESLGLTREASAAASKATADAKTAEIAQKAELEKRLESVMNDESLPDNIRNAARLKWMGIQPTGDVQTGRDHQAEADARAASSLERSLALMHERDRINDENRREKATAPPKDNPNLPQGVVNYLDEFLTKPKGNGAYTLDDAYAEVAQNMGKLRAAHPNLDAGQVRKYLLQLFPQNPLTGVREGYAGHGGTPASAAAPAAAPAPAPAPANDALKAKASELITQKLGRPATDADVAKFLSSPQNVQALSRQ